MPVFLNDGSDVLFLFEIRKMETYKDIKQKGRPPSPFLTLKHMKKNDF
jgi:hypothetical protein